MARTSDAAWRAITAARGHVEGKVLVMSRPTYRAILRERGIPTPPTRLLNGMHLLYGVRVHFNDFARFGIITLEEP